MRRTLQAGLTVAIVLFLAALMRESASRLSAPAAPGAAGLADDWPVYGHDPGGIRYSPLTEINRQNVVQLKVAWTFHTGDISQGSQDQRRSGFETTPIVVDGTLYLTTGFNRVIALDPEKGTQRWAYDPLVDVTEDYGDGLINRGVATWADPARASGQPCGRRIFEATLDARLIALDAATGAPCTDFGEYGQVSLRNVPRYVEGFYHMTSPPAVIDDLVVVARPSTTMRAPRCRAAWYERSRRALERCAGAGTRFLRTCRIQPRRALVRRSGELARPTPGQLWPSTRSAILFLFPPAAPVPTILAACGPETISGRTPLSPCTPERASWPGGSSLSTTTFGITTLLHHLCLPPSSVTAKQRRS